jgi:hypothetical protein
MSMKLSRMAPGFAVVAGLFSGIAALTYNPPPAYAQITCWVCVCSGSNCKCEQVTCPKAPAEDPPQG